MPALLNPRLAFAALVAFVLAAISPLAVAGDHVDIVHDLLASWDDAVNRNASAVESKGDERSANVVMPGLFLHPLNRGDAVVAWPGVRIPAATEASRTVLLFSIGFRDGVPWDEPKANGVRFGVAIGGEPVFAESHRGPGWQARAVDLSAFAGRTVELALSTEAIDGNPNWDWAIFGRPLVVSFAGTSDPAGLRADSTGLARVDVACTVPSTVEVSVGEKTTRTSLATGVRTVPVEFAAAAAPALRVVSGKAELRAARLALWAPHPEVEEFALSSPLVIVTEPFDALVRVRNRGLGTYHGDTGAADATVKLRGPDEDREETVRVGSLAPDAETTARWRGLDVYAAGEARLSLGDRSVDFHVFSRHAPRDTTRASRTARDARVSRSASGRVASLESHGARLRVVIERSGHAYGITEAAVDGVWLRTGSLYPLARLVALDGERRIERAWRAREESVAAPGELLLEGAFVDIAGSGNGDIDAGEAWPASIRLRAVEGAPRIALEYRFEFPRTTRVLALWGPDLLIGDRAGGAQRDFAIFPGLEYLESDEPSSSTRDLAPPHNDRRVPAVYELATPVMAVQSKNRLTALLWDAGQEWLPGRRHLAAHFLAPSEDSGLAHTRAALFVPPVGVHLEKNAFEASTPVDVAADSTIRLDAVLVVDHASRYASNAKRGTGIVGGPHRGGLVLEAMRHYFDAFGLPRPMPAPRGWTEEKALCRHAYFGAIWNEDPPGIRHCVNWKPDLLVGHALPLLLDRRDGADAQTAAEIDRRVDKLLSYAMSQRGPGWLWRDNGCHIALGELPYYRGWLPENLASLRDQGRRYLTHRRDGLWRWYPGSPKHATLGDAGGHTLGSAARSAWVVLRAARLSGDPELATRALDALKQLERYDVPRGAQMWECPLYQPDILASAYAIRAYCEAYRLTGDRGHLAYARYWAWTGLPFLYLWEIDAETYPTMRYNVISVIGSTFHTHSWIGLPVVWCGLVYAYALQDLALFDESFDWRTIALGIVRSTEWQQYADGPNKGCYPDSWSLADNEPRPADISPENILINEFRLRGLSPHIRHRRLESRGSSAGVAQLNSAADILAVKGSVDAGSLTIALRGTPGYGHFTTLAPVAEPTSSSLERVPDSAALERAVEGWLWNAELRAVVIKVGPRQEAARVEMGW